MMYSSEDLERFYFQYQTEALPDGESLQLFCVKNKVSYYIFQKRSNKNNLTERAIRKQTTQHYNSLYYGSDDGAEMAATYHSVIGTVKLRGSSVWNFIGISSKISLAECRDYANMVPDKITLATGQC